MKMKKATHRFLAGIVVTTLAAGLTACGTSHLSRIDAAGQSSEIVWPEIRPGGWMQEGTFPSIQRLQSVNKGMTKDQLYDALGRPHFREGVVGVREWDYIFNFRTGAPSGDYVTCQYKVLFDQDYRAQTFLWRDPKCADFLVDKSPAPAPAPVAPSVRRVNLSADTLFAFNRSGMADLLPGGRDEVMRVANEIKGIPEVSVTVYGHTDEIGSADSNQRLSQARAATVRQVMVDSGVNPGVIRAVGVGEAQPVKSCDSKAPRADYIACLQPNRRAEIEIVGLQQTQ